jgi:hypothetical protein
MKDMIGTIQTKQLVTVCTIIVCMAQLLEPRQIDKSKGNGSVRFMLLLFRKRQIEGVL